MAEGHTRETGGRQVGAGASWPFLVAVTGPILLIVYLPGISGPMAVPQHPISLLTLLGAVAACIVIWRLWAGRAEASPPVLRLLGAGLLLLLIPFTMGLEGIDLWQKLISVVLAVGAVLMLIAGLRVRSSGSGATEAQRAPDGESNPTQAGGAAQAPAFDDPHDQLIWQMIHATAASSALMMSQYDRCFATAEEAEKAYAMANAEYVDGVRQHEISRESFRRVGHGLVTELEGQLDGLRAATKTAREQWTSLLFLLPGEGSDAERIGNWCLQHDVASTVFSSLLANGVFVGTDFGTSRASFWAENERVTSALRASGHDK